MSAPGEKRPPLRVENQMRRSASPLSLDTAPKPNRDKAGTYVVSFCRVFFRNQYLHNGKALLALQ